MLKRGKKLRQEQAQETRQKLVETALKLFAGKGYAGTNMRAIGIGAGVAPGLLYHYFPGGKQELLREIVREKLGEVERCTSRWDADLLEISIEEALDRVFLNAVQIFEENLELFRLVIREEEAHDVLEFGALYEMLLGQQRWLPAILERHAARGELAPMDIECVTDTLFALITNYFLGCLAGLGDHHYYSREHCRKLLRYQCSLLRRGAVAEERSLT